MGQTRIHGTAAAALATFVAVITVACGEKGGGSAATSSPSSSAPSCADACAHLVELAKADIEKSLGRLGPNNGETAKALRDRVSETEASDKKNCEEQCGQGKLNTACIMKAETIDGAASCQRGRGVSTPTEPPKPRTEEDWPNATLVTQEGSVGGIAFRIDLPKELAPQDADASPTSVGWDFPGEPFSQPRFTISVGPRMPDTVEAGKALFSPSNEVLDARLEGDVFTLVYASKTYVVTYTLTRAGEKTIQCYGTHSSAAGIRDAKTLGAWLARVCGTTKPR